MKTKTRSEVFIASAAWGLFCGALLHPRIVGLVTAVVGLMYAAVIRELSR